MMKKYSALIMEDEAASLELMDLLLKQVENVDVVFHAQTIADAVVGTKLHKPDIMFCDVELPDGNCFDMFREYDIPSKAICIVTSYKDYAINAIKHGVVDYILKPIEITELELALSRMIQHLETTQVDREPVAANNILINDFRGCRVLSEEEILHVQADGQYTNVHLQNGSSILTSYTLAHFEQKLSKSFFRIHKSAVVNTTKVVSIDGGRGGSVRMSSGAEIPIAYRRKVELRKLVKLNS